MQMTLTTEKKMHLMLLVDLQQNTPKWLAFRTEKIGSSDSPIVAGLSPFKSASRLLLEKTGQITTPPPNFWQVRGREMESIARTAYEAESGNLVTPVVFQHDEHAFLIASLDGYDPHHNLLVEIKCCGPKTMQLAQEGAVPLHYYCQIQKQLLCSSASLAHYFCYSPTESALVVVERDENYMEELIEREAIFHHKMQQTAALLNGH